jgi:hypothetical protein
MRFFIVGDTSIALLIAPTTLTDFPDPLFFRYGEGGIVMYDKIPDIRSDILCAKRNVGMSDTPKETNGAFCTSN